MSNILASPRIPVPGFGWFKRHVPGLIWAVAIALNIASIGMVATILLWAIYAGAQRTNDAYAEAFSAAPRGLRVVLLAGGGWTLMKPTSTQIRLARYLETAGRHGWVSLWKSGFSRLSATALVTRGYAERIVTTIGNEHWRLTDEGRAMLAARVSLDSRGM